jgi:cytidyltransferase-like protein
LGILGGVRIGDDTLFQRVSVGGTFDGMHYGHRKLLTLAVSSVDPFSGSLLVGVTSDEMLTKKKLSRLIPPLSERMEAVRKFLDKLSPGLKNRRKIVPINDSFGPPGRESGFDALVLSHETLPTGHELNEHRVSIGLPKLKLLCTRRTEPNSMSSTALRRLRDKKQNQQVQ